MRKEPTSRWLTEYNFYTHPCYVFFFFQGREASVKSGRDLKGIVTEEWVVPGRQSSLSHHFCIRILFKFIFQTVLCSVFIVRKTLLKFDDFRYFIFKSLVHLCRVVSHCP